MITNDLFALPIETVKRDLHEMLEEQAGLLFERVGEGASVRELEQACWSMVLALGRCTMMYALALRCRVATAKDVEARGLAPKDVSIRTDADYWAELTTTFGAVNFPLHAYRDRSGVAPVTRVPARAEVLPFQRSCRSSELCLEWEVRLGSEHPFRKAQAALSYFTHGAVELEDTTIARHMVRVGQVIERDWTYRPAEEIQRIASERATRCRKSGHPIIYISTDAHALRRYVDETWDAQWKMANGVRLWCIDRHNGATIHLGGEYTWGDCHQVADIFRWLAESKRLPVDGNFGDGLRAQYVIVTDGADWIVDHVLPLFEGAVPILDAYHVMERLGEYAAKRFGRGTKSATAWYDKAVGMLLPGERSSSSTQRKGHRKRRKGPTPEVQPTLVIDAGRRPVGELLLEHLSDDTPSAGLQGDHDGLVKHLTKNVARVDYELFRMLGYTIGSGAMESLHRTASQGRMKIPGGRWLQETSQAIFNLRMMALAGRWTEFWSSKDLPSLLARAFSSANDDQVIATMAA